MEQERQDEVIKLRIRLFEIYEEEDRIEAEKKTITKKLQSLCFHEFVIEGASLSSGRLGVFIAVW